MAKCKAQRDYEECLKLATLLRAKVLNLPESPHKNAMSRYTRDMMNSLNRVLSPFK